MRTTGEEKKLDAALKRVHGEAARAAREGDAETYRRKLQAAELFRRRLRALRGEDGPPP